MKLNEDVLAALGESPTKEEKKATRASKYGGDTTPEPKKTARVKKTVVIDEAATDAANGGQGNGNFDGDYTGKVKTVEIESETKEQRKARKASNTKVASEMKKPVTLASLNKETERLEKAAKDAKERATAFARKEEMNSLKSQIKEAEGFITEAERTIENNAKLRDKLITKIDKLNAAWNAKEK